MADDSYPKYEIKSLKDGGGWYVVVTRHKFEYCGRFASEVEAQDWIARETNAKLHVKESIFTPPTFAPGRGIEHRMVDKLTE
jgi:hypothetical protein